MILYNPVTIRLGCASIAAIYGESATGWYWMPAGETGQEIWARSKLTKEVIEESIKKGSQTVLD